MKMTDYTAASLFDGGRRTEDMEQLIEEYEFTEDEADEIVVELKMIEERQLEETTNK